MNGFSLDTEADRLNLSDFVTKILDVQEGDQMKELTVKFFNPKEESQELTE